MVRFTGQIGGGEIPDGGRARLGPYPADFRTGLAAVLDAVPAEPEVAQPVNLRVTGVRVIATNYFSDRFDVSPSQSRFWVADAEGAMELFLDFRAVGATPPFSVAVGQSISFTAREVMLYGTKPEITAATDWSLDGQGDDVALFVPDRALELTDIHRMVRVVGTVEGEGDVCDRADAEVPNRCWELRYGHGEPGVLRTRSALVEPGACIAYVGPLGWYAGRANFDTLNYSWLRLY